MQWRHANPATRRARLRTQGIAPQLDHFSSINFASPATDAIREPPFLGRQRAKVHVNTSSRLPAAVNPPNGGTCVCCLEAPAVAVFYRCGHLCCCMACANTIFHGAAGSRLCPCCRAPIIEIIRAYGSQEDAPGHRA